jgi:hypothetical protein
MNERQLHSGLVRLFILHHASRTPVFGLEIIEDLARRGYRLSAGTLYPLLHSMERSGYLRSRRQEERFHKVEVQLRGLDVAMMEVGNRFTELTFAGRDRNRPHAKYKAERIGLVIRPGIEGRSKRAASAKPFLDEEIPAMLSAIERQIDEAFQAGIERFRTSRMRRHVAEKLPDFTLELPEHRGSPIRRTR